MDFLEEKWLHTPLGFVWKQIGTKHHHGIDVLLSGIRTKSSLGCGEFLDLVPLIDWCKEVGFDVIQLLPLYDTGNDPSPYNGVSSCALNPIFLNLQSLPLVEKEAKLSWSLSKLSYWNDTVRVQYEEVRKAKMAWLKEYFHTFSKLLTNLEGYKHFCLQHSWLKIYAIFMTLKEKNGFSPWQSWPFEEQNPDPTLIEKIYCEMDESVHFYSLIQWLCYEQLRQIKSHAYAQGILLKGDIPILISPDSADVWYHRDFFDLSKTVGASPDYYNPEGQSWGFPLFHWENIEKEGFSWWKDRLMYASEFYHLYRIDHVVGFFRLWAIPLEKSARDGFFIPNNLETALALGEKILRQLISFSSMLPIAEDLGNVPREVKHVLASLGIPGTFIMRWEKNPGNESEYLDPRAFPPLGMTSVSTHDAETLGLWWKEKTAEAMAYAKQKGWDFEKELRFEHLFSILYESHHSGSIFHINLLQEYLALFPNLVHTTPEDERINIPGKILPTNWTYRYRPTIEQLQEHGELKECLRKILIPE